MICHLSPLPITDYVSTIQLRAVTDTDRSGEFNCAPNIEPELMKTVLSVYQGGFDFSKRQIQSLAVSEIWSKFDRAADCG